MFTLHMSFLNLTHSNTHLFFFLFLSLTTLSYSTSSKFSYSQNCAHVIPESNLIGHSSSDGFPSFNHAYVINADQILAPNAQITAYFFSKKGFKTVTKGVYKMDSFLRVRTTGLFNSSRHSSITRVKFQLSGFWDSGSGKLCMVGYGLKRLETSKRLRFDVVFKMTYPSSTNITTSLISGTLESLNVERSESHFTPIRFLALADMEYEYTLVKEIDKGIQIEDDKNPEELSSIDGCMFLPSVLETFKLVHTGSNHLEKLFGFFPRFMSFNKIECSDQKMIRVLFHLSNIDDNQLGFNSSAFSPSRTLVAEGAWNQKINNQFYFVACRILNFNSSPLKASVGDCSIRMNLTIHSSLNIRSRGVVTGHIWSNKSANQPGYFTRTEIRALDPFTGARPEMKYQYTEMKKVKKYCSEKKALIHKGKTYPKLYPEDLIFWMEVRNGKAQTGRGTSHPVFVGSQLVQNTNSYVMSSTMDVNDSHIAPLNLTYLLQIYPMGEFKVGSEILSVNKTMVVSAEGSYDADTGRICMVGCWNRENDSTDCEILIDIQIPSLDSNDSDFIRGSIESKRAKTDHLYFDSLHLSSTSMMKTQIADVYFRMDIEIIMVLVSNALICIFVVLQIFHVRRNTNVLPYISLMMLALTTLGHLIPLLLNMEAFFISRRNLRTVLFEDNGWLEINEVLVRVITMIAFLLESRLLQLTWQAKVREEDTTKPSWIAEKKVVCYSLPLYITISFIVWLVKSSDSDKQSPPDILYLTSDSTTLPYWHDIKSYAGFILDAFLMPQIMFNIFANTRDAALSMPYYVGTTMVRLLPHAYELFRAHSAGWSFDFWLIYTDYSGMNYYSTSWNIAISFIGMLLAFILYLQQRFGGRSILPKRFRMMVEYEKVPTRL